ncbi:MAG: tetratricopeptide repeat protein [Thermoanaerobaculia bacterium]
MRERGLAPELLIWPWELGSNLRQWLSRQAVGRSPAERVEVAFNQLLASGGRALQYDDRVTGTADEVFASGRANCLGFTLLFVGLARELGVEAGFFRVDRGQSYRREGDLIFVSEHITGGYEVGGEERLIEFTLGPEVDYRRVREISDLSAMALFYSNRGAEALRSGDAGEAVRWLEVAVRLDETEASAWSNLGVARRRLGELEPAEAVYRRAIELDPDHLAAYINLAGVLRLRGESDAARQIVRLLDRGDNRNPYAYLALGDASLEEGRLDDARRYYRRAVRLSRRDAEPRAAMGLWALSNGDPRSARRWLRRARRIDQLEQRTMQLEQRLNEHSRAPGAAAAAGGPEPSNREVES